MISIGVIVKGTHRTILGKVGFNRIRNPCATQWGSCRVGWTTPFSTTSPIRRFRVRRDVKTPGCSSLSDSQTRSGPL